MSKKAVIKMNRNSTGEFEKKDRAEHNIEPRRAFDDFYKGKCFVVKERADSFRLKHFPNASPKETNKKFKTGDRVKNQYGKLLTVLAQIGKMVIVKEENKNYLPQHLTIIERAVDTFQV